MPMKSVAAVLFAALAVAACTNGPSQKDYDEARDEATAAAAAQAEAEAAREAAEQRARAAEAALAEPLLRLNNIVGKVNRVLISRLYVGGIPGTGFHYACFPHGCGGTGQGFMFAPAEISRWIFEDGVTPEREIEGLEIAESNPEDGGWRAYGVWMDHSAAFLSRYGGRVENADLFIASSFGARSGEPLPVEGSATWRGAMVGVDVATTDRYAGSANLTATFGAGQRMEVSFTDIGNVETGASREDILFSDETPVGLYADGRFFGHSGHDDFNRAPIYLDGQLYGPDHAEAAGVFGYNELIGAFAAQRVNRL